MNTSTRRPSDLIRTIRSILNLAGNDEETLDFNQGSLDDNHLPIPKVVINVKLHRNSGKPTEIEFHRHLGLVKFIPGSDMELVGMANQLSLIEAIDSIKINAVKCGDAPVRLEIGSHDQGLIDYLRKVSQRAA